jgi:hypothetical protein
MRLGGEFLAVVNEAVQETNRLRFSRFRGCRHRETEAPLQYWFHPNGLVVNGQIAGDVAAARSTSKRLAR